VARLAIREDFLDRIREADRATRSAVLTAIAEFARPNPPQGGTRRE